ncbi:adenylate/guanylate cyclase domain-containing protein [Allomuricauda sp. F6463D]|uniref:adenylate/guanylate cyclase domain-containing protein n=1 Tax=Allomuricauda sp. F6463D TaxID=2926409 RepID=UPI001FF171C3|nr:adenylate/guanylate cyclase domain-containing protein [Muricauda sp. F6463D]MCK0160755.1 adenylate/guanylate cyclase domain-containing protein [Muricauda sp. F6463D]
MNENCIRCFYSMKKSLQKKSEYFEKTYGMIPSFRAGLHMGIVTTGEIGALKKEIFFTGDVLNVTARIQKLCKQFHQELIVSEQLAKPLGKKGVDFATLGTMELEGRKKPVKLFVPK